MPEIVDLFAFVRDASAREGLVPISALPRLAEECSNPLEQVTWTAVGRREVVAHQYDATGNPIERDLLVIAAQTALLRTCDRCGKPVEVPLEIQTRLTVYRTDAEADAAPVDDDACDPVVGSRRFDLLAQLEEELLLAIPGFSAHGVCPAPQEPGLSLASKPNPFAALAVLKKKN